MSDQITANCSFHSTLTVITAHSESIKQASDMNSINEAWADSHGKSLDQPNLDCLWEAARFYSSQESKRGSLRRDAVESGGKNGRKLKSLAVLCKRFLDKYHASGSKIIKVDEISHQLGVERRRIYDIMNIFMAIFVISKKGKNCYVWNGLANFQNNIKKLEELPTLVSERLLVSHCASLDSATLVNLSPGSGECGVPLARYASFDPCKKEKSLELLTQQFLSLLMKYKIIGMSDLANVLIDSSEKSPSCYKTKIRRLYDIANVMSTLGIVEKIKTRSSSSNGNKIRFSWTGVDRVKNWLAPNTRRESGSESDYIRIQSIDTGYVEISSDSDMECSFKKDLGKLIGRYPEKWSKIMDSEYVKRIASQVAEIDSNHLQ